MRKSLMMEEITQETENLAIVVIRDLIPANHLTPTIRSFGVRELIKAQEATVNNYLIRHLRLFVD